MSREEEDSRKRIMPESFDAERPFKSSKRENVLAWEDYFMAMAVLASYRSKDPKTQVGACIVNEENKIVSVGYNGFPKGCSDDEFPWTKESGLQNKHLYVCHAEVNAILNSKTHPKGCDIYVTLFPCNECAKFIIQSGIKEVIYKNYRDHIQSKASQKMFDAAGVSYRSFKSKQQKVVIVL